MKKRKPELPGSELPWGLSQLTIWDALEGDNRFLTERLRKGIASPEEMALAADLIQKKIKPRRLKKGQPKQLENYAMAQMVFLLEASGGRLPQRKTIIPDVAEAFGVSERHVYNALTEFGDRVLQTKVLREANEQAFRQWLEQIARK
jgi:hypothetical protein